VIRLAAGTGLQERLCSHSAGGTAHERHTQMTHGGSDVFSTLSCCEVYGKPLFLCGLSSHGRQCAGVRRLPGAAQQMPKEARPKHMVVEVQRCRQQIIMLSLFYQGIECEWAFQQLPCVGQTQSGWLCSMQVAHYAARPAHTMCYLCLQFCACYTPDPNAAFALSIGSPLKVMCLCWGTCCISSSACADTFQAPQTTWLVLGIHTG